MCRRARGGGKASARGAHQRAGLRMDRHAKRFADLSPLLSHTEARQRQGRFGATALRQRDRTVWVFQTRGNHPTRFPRQLLLRQGCSPAEAAADTNAQTFTTVDSEQRHEQPCWACGNRAATAVPTRGPSRSLESLRSRGGRCCGSMVGARYAPRFQSR